MGSAYVAKVGWNGTDLPLWIARTSNPTLEATRCVITVGVSSIRPITWVRSQRPAPRQEFAMIVRDEAEHSEEVVDVLTALAVDAVEEHRVFDQGLIYERVN